MRTLMFWCCCSNETPAHFPFAALQALQPQGFTHHLRQCCVDRCDRADESRIQIVPALIQCEEISSKTRRACDASGTGCCFRGTSRICPTQRGARPHLRVVGTIWSTQSQPSRPGNEFTHDLDYLRKIATRISLSEISLMTALAST